MRTSEIIGSWLGTAKASANGSAVNDTATKKANMVRAMHMQLLELIATIGPPGWSVK